MVILWPDFFFYTPLPWQCVYFETREHFWLLTKELSALSRRACSCEGNETQHYTRVGAVVGKSDRDRLTAANCKHGGVHSYRAVSRTPLLLVWETETPQKWRPKRSSTSPRSSAWVSPIRTLFGKRSVWQRMTLTRQWRCWQTKAPDSGMDMSRWRVDLPQAWARVGTEKLAGAQERVVLIHLLHTTTWSTVRWDERCWKSVWDKRG